MPTPDPNNVLFQIAHPDLYERNPFNVLNLPVDATAKDIRRRKEDIEAAFDAGTEAAEFANILPGDESRKTPTRAEVDDLFTTLENPEKRIAYALFWFWPEDMGSVGREANRKRVRNPNGAFGHHEVVAVWDRDARLPDGSTSTQFISRHNLAVFHHMMGLAYELELKSIPPTDADTPDYVHGYWRSSIYWWNEIAGEPDFWRHVSELVSALDDPRVDYQFARALRDQFAFAFDQINVELAIDFAKTGRETDAKRQVEYMKLSQPDSDDVEGTFDDAFAGLLRQTEAVVNSARDEARKHPEEGLKKANEILSQTAEPLRVSRIVFDKGAPIRDSIVTTIFAGVRSCLIAYGNATEDWDNCIDLTRKLETIAETDNQRNTVKKDALVCQSNKHASQCCCCGKPVKDGRLVATTCTDILDRIAAYKDSLTIHMYGEVRKGNEYGKVSFKTTTIAVPICWMCADAILRELGRICARRNKFQEEKRNSGISVMSLSMPIAPIVPTTGYESMSSELESLLRSEIQRMENAKKGIKEPWVCDYSKGLQAILKYSDVSNLLAKGWKIGKEVSQKEIQSLWGISRTGLSSYGPMGQSAASQVAAFSGGRGSGCMIPLLAFIGSGLACIFIVASAIW